ncbi:MAG: cupin domain-containing protein [Rhodothermales bacterium]|nr:cupin domain-containing protein [Rhodothermales bacterium]
MPDWHVPFADALARVPTPEGQRFATVFRHGTLEAELYAPEGRDLQTPHARDEVYVVARGSGTFVRDGARVRCGAGDFLFVPAGMDHRFEAFTDDFAVWVLFYGPDGGEHPAAERPR